MIIGFSETLENLSKYDDANKRLFWCRGTGKYYWDTRARDSKDEEMCTAFDFIRMVGYESFSYARRSIGDKETIVIKIRYES